jgi:hypothetical protein
MPSSATRTKYAADTDGMVCLLLDIRGQARPNSLQVFSYSKGRVVSLPRRRRDGRDLIRIETPDAKRWSAISLPRWLAQAEGLYGKPELPPIMSGFCREFTTEIRTPQMIRDDAERELAQYIVDRENKYRKLPGQRLQDGKADLRNGAMFA